MKKTSGKIKEKEKINVNNRSAFPEVAEVAEVKKEESGQDNYIIYNNSIYSYVDEFIDSNYPGLTDQELKENKAFFPLLVQYLYINCIGDILRNKLEYKLQGIKPEYRNIKLIDNIFNIYIDLVYKYKWNNKPFINEFSILTGISRDSIYNWLNGTIDNYILDSFREQDRRKYITSEYSDTVRKWQVICEQSLVDGSGEYIKEIFLLKALHGYKDNNNDINITVNHKAVISANDLPDLIGIPGSGSSGSGSNEGK